MVNELLGFFNFKFLLEILTVITVGGPSLEVTFALSILRELE